MQHALLWPYIHSVTKRHEGEAYGSRDMLQKEKKSFDKLCKLGI